MEKTKTKSRQKTQKKKHSETPVWTLIKRLCSGRCAALETLAACLGVTPATLRNRCRKSHCHVDYRYLVQIGVVLRLTAAEYHTLLTTAGYIMGCVTVPVAEVVWALIDLHNADVGAYNAVLAHYGIDAVYDLC